MLSQIKNILQHYFLEPVRLGTGYNLVNTLAYAVLFVVALFLLYRVFKRQKIKIDRHFLLGVVPYIVLGSVLRVLRDAQILKSALFVTPLIYFVTAFLALVALFMSRLIETKRMKYYKIWFGAGVALALIAISFLRLANLHALSLILAMTFIWLFVAAAIRKIFNPRILSIENSALLLVHIFDATSTFVSLEFFGYAEQHVLSSAVISALGPAGMYILKIPVVLIALYFVDKEKDADMRNIIKLAVLVLGLGPGLRNTLRLAMGV